MSKSRGPVKKLMDKQKSLASTFANGDYKRWSNASVGTDERDGHWYDGCDFDTRRLQSWKDDQKDGIARPKPKRYNPRSVQGDRHAVVPASDAIPLCRRDGGMADNDAAARHAALELQAIYNKYVAVYDKVSVTRKRTTYYRRRAMVMTTLNGYLAVR